MAKKCNKCKEIKDVSNFYRRKQKASLGYRYLCKACDNIASNARRKKNGWIKEKKRQGLGSKHSKKSKVNSQKHRIEMSDMYIRSLMTKRSKVLNPEDIPIELVDLHRENFKLKRLLELTRKLKGEEVPP